MPKKVTDKEYYSLLWEYLRRGEHYREYVEWYKKVIKKQKAPFPEKVRLLLRLWRPITDFKLFACCEAKGKSIDDFLRYRSELIKIGRRKERRSPVQPLHECVKNDYGFSIECFERYSGLKNTAADFRDFQGRNLAHEDRYVIDFMYARGSEALLGQIERTVAGLLKKYRAEMNDRRTMFKQWRICLEVYDVATEKFPGKEKYTQSDICEIIEAMGNKADKHDKKNCLEDYVQKKYKRYIQEARELIRQAERGFFPPASFSSFYKDTLKFEDMCRRYPGGLL